MRYQHPPMRILIWQRLVIICTGDKAEQLELSNLDVGTGKWPSHFENEFE